jgi:serine/threonine protein kinase/tetratricopeptide (TPR) repeat protein
MAAPRPDNEAIFHAARDISDPERRREYVRQACGGYEARVAHIEALLAAADTPDSLLDRRAGSDPVATIDRPPPGSPGTRIGPYKLIEPIGEGGMGTVWMAQQTEPVRRLVALKLIKAGMDSRQVIARFEAERQALALMDHPNIARVLDGGTTSAGRLYFVMDLVKGVPITGYCDEHHLTLRQRLELFVPVCQAVQHAHQKGIIHRDLKPSNVLVALYDGRPVPKVIDFGVAKAAGQTLTDKTLVTGFGAIVGTLEYMSPEQAEINQLDIDTRSDIYSLGVLLYELLAGSPPFSRKELEKAGMLEMLRAIREQEPSKPSTRLSTADGLPTLAANRGTEPAKLTRLVRGELDWIVMKALDKDRSRRYDTANAFAMDVQRYLADEPVQAGPPSAGYRVRKFARRNRAAVLTAAAILFVLVAGIAGTTFGLIRAEHRRAEAEKARADEAAQRLIAEAQRKEAERARADEAVQRQIAEAEKKKAEQAEADTLADYRASTDDAIEQLIGSKSNLGPQERAYLGRTLKRWQAFAARHGDDRRSQAVRAEGHHHVAILWSKLGRLGEARAEYETTRDLYAKLAAAFPDEPAYQRSLALTTNSLGLLLLDLGRDDAARTELEAARDLQQKLAAAFPAMPQYQNDLAGTHRNLGVLLMTLGQREAARTEYELARDLQRKLAAAFPATPRYQIELALTHLGLGVLLRRLGQREAARTEYELARDLQQKLAAAFPAVPQYQSDLAATHNNLGNVLADLGRRDAARTELETSINLKQKLVAAFPAVLQYQVDLGGSYCNFGDLVRDEGQPADSLRWFDLAIRTLTPVYEQDRRHAMARQFLRNSHCGRAVAYDRLQRHADAVTDWDKAIELDPGLERPAYRAGRAISRLQAGQTAEAVAEVEELTKASKWSAEEWYSFACVYAVASTKFADRKQEYADRAMELLGQAVQAGYKNAAHLARDRRFDPLRHREDLQKLLAELEAGKK